MNMDFWEFVKETIRDYFKPARKAWFWIVSVALTIVIMLVKFFSE